jgi:hypothetical protein
MEGKMKKVPSILAYLYPGWVRNRSFDEWRIVLSAKSSFKGHEQPKKPLDIYYYDQSNCIRDQIELAQEHGIEGFVFCWYWDMGSVVLPQALDSFKKAIVDYPNFKFALMWANRSPHKSLPISRDDLDGNFYRAFSDRDVKTSPKDIVDLVEYCRTNFFHLSNYLSFENKPLFLIFSMKDLLRHFPPVAKLSEGYFRTLFGRELSIVSIAHGLEDWLEDAKRIGVDAVTSYVLLPDWHGCEVQDYERYAKRASLLWENIASLSMLPYFPSVCTGWDSTPRGKEAIAEGRKTYPWSPVVIENTPEKYGHHLQRGIEFCIKQDSPFLLVSSWNEWSEGHYLEPDQDNGNRRLCITRDVLNQARKD